MHARSPLLSPSRLPRIIMGAAGTTHIVAFVPLGASVYQAVVVARVEPFSSDAVLLPSATEVFGPGAAAAVGRAHPTDDLCWRFRYRRSRAPLRSMPVHGQLASVARNEFGFRTLCLELEGGDDTAWFPRTWRTARSSAVAGAGAGAVATWAWTVGTALAECTAVNRARLRADPVASGRYARRSVLRDGTGPEIGDYMDRRGCVHALVTREEAHQSPAGAVARVLMWNAAHGRYVPRTRVCVHLRRGATHLRTLLGRMRRDEAPERVHLVQLVDLWCAQGVVSVYATGVSSHTPALVDLLHQGGLEAHSLRRVLVGVCHGLRHLNLVLGFVHHHVSVAAVYVDVRAAVGRLGDLWDVSPVLIDHRPENDNRSNSSVRPHVATIASDIAALLLLLVSVLSGVDWMAFTVTHVPASLGPYRDLVHRARPPFPPLPPVLLDDLQRLCETFPAALEHCVDDDRWGPVDAERYERMASALLDGSSSGGGRHRRAASA